MMKIVDMLIKTYTPREYASIKPIPEYQIFYFK